MQTNKDTKIFTYFVHPIVHSTIAVGDVCVFQMHKPDLNWKIGRVLHFANYLAKTKASQQYRGLSANGVGSCSALGGLCTLSGHNFYGENYIPMEGHQKLGGHQAPLPPGSYAYVTTKVSDKNIGVLCSWYTLVDATSRKFSLSDSAVSHVHVSINDYLCTLPGRCFEESESASITNSIGKINPEALKHLP